MKKSPESGSNFSMAFKILTEAQRTALSSYYAFARAVDDIVDNNEKDAETKKTELAAWRKKVDSLFLGLVPENDELCQKLAQAIVFYNLKKEHFTLLIDGMEMDIEKHEYATIEELEYYMYRVAGVVGEVCLIIFGYQGANAKEIATVMGYAVQLTNIIRDVREDYEAGRVYIPYQDLARFNCGKDQFSAPGYSKEFTDMMAFETERAKKYYSDTLALVDRPHKSGFKPSLLIWNIYYDLLLKIEKNAFHVKEGKIKTTKKEKFISALKTIVAYLKL